MQCVDDWGFIESHRRDRYAETARCAEVAAEYHFHPFAGGQPPIIILLDRFFLSLSDGRLCDAIPLQSDSAQKPMVTGEIRSQIDRIWDTFWSGGISNPLEVIEQITYLLFLKRLDEQETAEELKANQTKKPMQKRFFPEGKDSKKRRYQDYRWKNFKNFEPRDMYTVVGEHVFPWLRTLGGNGTTYSKHMEGARFTIPTPALLAKVVDMIDKVPMEDRDTKGDLYEYMLGKIATAGQNGQFRTPRHIIRLMVEMVEPKPTDVVCDPACGTCGFLVAVGESLRERHPEVLINAKLREHFHHKLFHGFDFDNTMLRIGSTNMLLSLRRLAHPKRNFQPLGIVRCTAQRHFAAAHPSTAKRFC